MPRAAIIAVAALIVIFMVVLANRNTEVAPQRIEKPVKLGGAAGDAAPAP